MAGCYSLLFFRRCRQEAWISAGCDGVLAVKRGNYQRYQPAPLARRLSSPELTVFRFEAIGEVEIDAAAAALRRGKLNQFPSFGLVMCAEFRPSRRGCQPAQLGQAIVYQRIADQPAARHA